MATTRSIAPRREKYEAIVNLIAECRETGQPLLVGTGVDREVGTAV
jgi:preprotein translocase subunit SecA